MAASVNPFECAGRTVLVTGASSGIGRDAAIVLSELGATVVVSGRDLSRLAATRSRLAEGSHAIEPFDLSDLAAIPAWMSALAERHGPLNGVLHCAGVRKTVPLRGLSLEALHQTFRTNVDSAVMIAKGLRQKGCHAEVCSLVLLGSVAAQAGAPAIAAYAASKAALEGLARSLAIEFAPEGIRVNCLAPGMVSSEMTDQVRASMTDAQFAALGARYPLGLGTTRDVAWAAAYLLSPAAAWMTGHTLVLDGGFSAQ